jgi:hypothetical protein
LKWDELVPPQKLAALKTRLQGCKGHPPQGPHAAAPKTPLPKLPADAARSLTLGKPATASNVYGLIKGRVSDKARFKERFLTPGTDPLE